MAKTLMLMVTAFTVAILPNFGVCILELLLTHKLYPMTQFESWDVTAHVGMNAFGYVFSFEALEVHVKPLGQSRRLYCYQTVSSTE